MWWQDMVSVENLMMSNYDWYGHHLTLIGPELAGKEVTR
jgi:drug/metabolite transporter superfamily protein YnfA